LQVVVTIMAAALGLSLIIRLAQIWEAVLVLTAGTTPRRCTSGP
jgi:hypothetical protein